MRNTTFASKAACTLALMALPMTASLSAQQAELPAQGSQITVTGMVPADLEGMPAGPEIDGFISARKGERMQVTTAEGVSTTVAISDASQIRASGGFLGLSKDKLGADALLNGLPVTVETVQWGNTLIARKVAVKNRDLKTARMISTGTAQGFAEQTAATDALRSRVADIDNYNVVGTTNVYFDTGKWALSSQAQQELCAAAQQANATDNALLLVVGYTDSTGSYEINQELSEKRATRVVNYLQQACGWKPYRMLTPTGMAEADPAADNTTDYGKQQNRRVAVNILVSKAVEGL
ncbi:OmpA family protein [Erythrobacter sp. SDW2]|uniref:OmpA family protein n=1 Tax=Erythrobacter sp. SDW2 TaxID=2907154 RepID=UPI001F296BAB|nr:OmpA family protein [Erythrobacter sp. SDW2]UIP08002.1 OmpA family protein [Erythrobacter sp. SDW2]